MMTRIGQVVMLLHAGDREEARNRFALLWEETGEDGDALHRCTIAHYMADTQDDPERELEWDLRALAAADSLSDERVRQHDAAVRLRGFYPSLHLNLAADYAKLGRPERARAELARARAASAVLDTGDAATGPYAAGVLSAIDRLETRLADGAGQSP
ncbi:hypothetical protein [Streptomyces albus]|uniref:hypothetical protein n=1 Tax=Streptomyces albus TaxID=1888 RepID=UPI0004C97A62|nr:hypothetical protein [Streptomyces albus]